MMNDRRNVCFCLMGHPVFYAGNMQPPNCRSCGAHINLARGFMPVTEAQKQGLLDPPAQKEETAAPNTEPVNPTAEPAQQTLTPPAPVQAIPPASAFGLQKPPQTPVAPAYAQAILTPAMPSASPSYTPAAPSVPSSPVYSAPQATPAPTYAPCAPVAPPQPTFIGQQFTSTADRPQPTYAATAASSCSANPQSGYALNFFGEMIEIPQAGGWLGRSELGSTWLKGNLLISRRHVHVRPTPDGMLSLGPDSSLNGVSYDTGSGKAPLRPSETVILPLGSIIWLYNIPLKLERISK